MASARNNVVNEFVDMLGPLLGNQMTRQHPKIPIDIINEEKTMYIYAEIPGVKKENIDIDVYNNKLTISIDKIKPYEEPDTCEIRAGHFERTITLPICITRKETINISYADGILKIKINKLIEEENKFNVKIE